MAIELTEVSSGYSTGVINSNFEAIEAYINDNLLNRDGTSLGEPNQMELNLDMNGFAILNASIDPDDPESLLTVEQGDLRYVNLTGDTMAGGLDMSTFPITVRVAVDGDEPARKDELDATITNYQAADANLQAQISGGDPLEASAFSEISWHDQIISNSVTIPDNKNAWSIGPDITVASGQSVTVGDGSFWTIVEGNQVTMSVENFDEGSL